MTINFGTLGEIARNACTIQRLERKAPDERSEKQDVWVDCCKTRVGFPAQTSGMAANMERLDNMQMIGRSIQYAEMQWPGFDIDSTRMRLVINGSVYNINGAENIENRNRMVRLVVIKEPS